MRAKQRPGPVIQLLAGVVRAHVSSSLSVRSRAAGTLQSCPLARLVEWLPFPDVLVLIVSLRDQDVDSNGVERGEWMLRILPSFLCIGNQVAYTAPGNFPVRHSHADIGGENLATAALCLIAQPSCEQNRFMVPPRLRQQGRKFYGACYGLERGTQLCRR